MLRDNAERHSNCGRRVSTAFYGHRLDFLEAELRAAAPDAGVVVDRPSSHWVAHPLSLLACLLISVLGRLLPAAIQHCLQLVSQYPTASEESGGGADWLALQLCGGCGESWQPAMGNCWHLALLAGRGWTEPVVCHHLPLLLPFLAHTPKQS